MNHHPRQVCRRGQARSSCLCVQVTLHGCGGHEATTKPDGPRLRVQRERWGSGTGIRCLYTYSVRSVQLYHPDSTQYRYQAQEADPLHIRYISDKPPCQYGISAGVLRPACTLCCSVSSHPTSTLMEQAGIIRWALCEMRVAARKCTTEAVGRAVWDSLQTIKGLRATKETMPSFRSNDLDLGPIIASDASGAWCLGSHTGRVGSGHVSGGKTQRAATRARPAGRTRIEGCGSVQGLHPQYYSKGGVARGEYSVHEVSRHCKQVDGAARLRLHRPR